jgi:8-oxo-dGTP pyrophosphatase MutT (NUDIX family)
VADPAAFFSGPPAARVDPAATVVALRDGPVGIEVLMLRRNSRGPFGGMWVFPGGKVDPADQEAVGVGTSLAGDGRSDDSDPEIAAARVAAVREAAEEAALDLHPDRLITLSFWMPPPEAPRRFATWFFLAEVPAAQGPVVVDQQEIRAFDWMTPAEAITRCNAGEIELAPPTFTTLWWLRDRSSVAAAMADAESGAPERFATHVAASGNALLTIWDGDVAYEGGDVERPGPRRRLVMEPGAWRVEMSTGFHP